MLTYILFYVKNIKFPFSEVQQEGMEKLGEYAQEESPETKTRNLPREPMLEEGTANSSELL